MGTNRRTPSLLRTHLLTASSNAWYGRCYMHSTKGNKTAGNNLHSVVFVASPSLLLDGFHWFQFLWLWCMPTHALLHSLASCHRNESDEQSNAASKHSNASGIASTQLTERQKTHTGCLWGCKKYSCWCNRTLCSVLRSPCSFWFVLLVCWFVGVGVVIVIAIVAVVGFFIDQERGRREDGTAAAAHESPTTRSTSRATKSRAGNIDLTNRNDDRIVTFTVATKRCAA